MCVYVRNAWLHREPSARSWLVGRRAALFRVEAGGSAVSSSSERLSAMPPAAQVAPRALVVVCAAGSSPEHPVVFPADHPLVTRTVFLEWDDAAAVGAGVGSARKQLATAQSIRAFGRRLRFTQAPAQRPAVIPGVLEIAFTGAAWSKYLNELLVSGLLSATFDSLHTLDEAIDRLTIVSLANLTVVAVDLQLGESTLAVAPAVARVNAVPGSRGRRGQAAIPAVPGRPPLHNQLEFLGTAELSVASLERRGTAPWAGVAFLCGALGPCLTQASRNAAGSSARLTASALINGMSKVFGTATDDHSALASDLPSFLNQLCAQLPPAFRCQSVNAKDLRLELRDSIRYGQGHDARVFVETSRIELVSSSYPLIKAFIIDMAFSNEDAYRAGGVARAGLLREDSASAAATLGHCLPELEHSLGSHLAILQPAAARPGATAMSVVNTLVQSLSVIQHRAPSSQGPAAASATAGQSAPSRGGTDGIEAALRAGPFCAFVHAFGVCDTTTVAGSLEGIAAGFSRDCVLTVRLLCHGERNLARRHSHLAGLLALRPHLPSYFRHYLVENVSTRVVPYSRLRRDWNLNGSDGSSSLFLEQFLTQDLVSMDWMGLACQLGHPSWRSALPPADHYCAPFVESWLIGIGECLLGSIGVPLSLPGQTCVLVGGQPFCGWGPLPLSGQAGFTWRSWWTFYVEHIRYGTQHMPSRERMLDWLDDAHAQALAAMRLMSHLLRTVLTSAEPASVQLGALLPADCRPATILYEYQLSFQRLSEAQSAMPHVFGEGGSDGWNADCRVFFGNSVFRSERHGTAVQALTASRKRPSLAVCGEADQQPSRQRPSIHHGNLKRIRKLHPPIDGRGPCYYHFQPGERCPNGASCPFHHGA